MADQLSPSQRAGQNRSRLLKAEVGLLALLLATRKRLRTGNATEFQQALAAAVMAGRASARAAGSQAARLELELLGIGPGSSVAPDIAAEAARAVRATQGATAKARALLRADADPRPGLKSTLERIAATENADAFGQGRADVTGAAYTNSVLYRVWDSTLDKLTCPVCFHADGTIVRLSEPFPHGTPGAVHPWCRCTWNTITLFEARQLRAA